MSTFSQWFKKVQKSPTPALCTWLCGDQPVLQEEILDHICAHLDTSSWSRATYFSGLDPEADIWHDIFQRPLPGDKKIIVVRNAGNLARPERLIDFINTRSKDKNTYLVLIDNGNSIPRKPPTEEEIHQYRRPPYTDYIDKIAKRGTLVDCRKFTQGTAETAVEWVMSKVNVREGVASHLLDRANGDLRVVRDACVLLSAYTGTITVRTVNALFSQVPAEDFVTALMKRDKPTALIALARLEPTEFTKVVSDLDQRLSIAGRVHDLLIAGNSQSEIARDLGGARIYVPDLLDVAKHYTIKNVLKLRNILATVDGVLRMRYDVGTMEALVALW